MVYQENFRCFFFGGVLAGNVAKIVEKSIFFVEPKACRLLVLNGVARNEPTSNEWSRNLVIEKSFSKC